MAAVDQRQQAKLILQYIDGGRGSTYIQDGDDSDRFIQLIRDGYLRFSDSTPYYLYAALLGKRPDGTQMDIDKDGKDVLVKGLKIRRFGGKVTNTDPRLGDGIPQELQNFPPKDTSNLSEKESAKGILKTIESKSFGKLTKDEGFRLIDLINKGYIKISSSLPYTLVYKLMNDNPRLDGKEMTLLFNSLKQTKGLFATPLNVTNTNKRLSGTKRTYMNKKNAPSPPLGIPVRNLTRRAGATLAGAAGAVGSGLTSAAGAVGSGLTSAASAAYRRAFPPRAPNVPLEGEAAQALSVVSDINTNPAPYTTPGTEANKLIRYTRLGYLSFPENITYTFYKKLFGSADALTKEELTQLVDHLKVGFTLTTAGKEKAMKAKLINPPQPKTVDNRLIEKTPTDAGKRKRAKELLQKIDNSDSFDSIPKGDFDNIIRLINEGYINTLNTLPYQTTIKLMAGQPVDLGDTARRTLYSQLVKRTSRGIANTVKNTNARLSNAALATVAAAPTTTVAAAPLAATVAAPATAAPTTAVAPTAAATARNRARSLLTRKGASTASSGPQPVDTPVVAGSSSAPRGAQRRTPHEELATSTGLSQVLGGITPSLYSSLRSGPLSPPSRLSLTPTNSQSSSAAPSPTASFTVSNANSLEGQNSPTASINSLEGQGSNSPSAIPSGFVPVNATRGGITADEIIEGIKLEHSGNNHSPSIKRNSIQQMILGIKNRIDNLVLQAEGAQTRLRDLTASVSAGNPISQDQLAAINQAVNTLIGNIKSSLRDVGLDMDNRATTAIVNLAGLLTTLHAANASAGGASLGGGASTGGLTGGGGRSRANTIFNRTRTLYNALGGRRLSKRNRRINRTKKQKKRKN